MDIRVVIIVVGIIGLDTTILIAVIGYGMLTEKPVDAIVAGLAGTALGYLGGLLTSVRTNREPSVPVKTEIVNTAENAVNTQDVPSKDDTKTTK